MQDILRAYAKEHKDLAVIRGIGWDRTWFSGGLQGIVRPITRHDIDAVVADRREGDGGLLGRGCC